MLVVLYYGDVQQRVQQLGLSGLTRQPYRSVPPSEYRFYGSHFNLLLGRPSFQERVPTGIHVAVEQLPSLVIVIIRSLLLLPPAANYIRNGGILNLAQFEQLGAITIVPS